MSNPLSDFCPYVGLAPFESEHSDYYFGRHLDAAALADNAIASPLTVLYGSSGTGKTSLLNVGLPRAIEEIHRDVCIVSFRNWRNEDFLASLISEITGAPTDTPLPPPNLSSLYKALQWKSHQLKRLIVLVLDQFEEYFVYERHRTTEGSLENELARIMEDKDLKVHLLISIREDRFHLLDRLTIHIPGILENTLELEHLFDDAVREAIIRPIEIYNGRYRRNSSPVIVSPAFVDRLIDELKEVRGGVGRAPGGSDGEQPIELPYLQLAMEKIWDAEGGANAIYFNEAILNKRPIKQIIDDHLNEVMKRLDDEEKRICANIFDRLVTRSGAKFAMTAYDLCPYASVDEEYMARMLRKLADNNSRLLKTVPASGDKPAFEIFHDVLGHPLLCWQERYQAENRSKAERMKLEREAKESRDRAAAANRMAQLYRKVIIAVSLLLLTVAGAGIFSWHQWRIAEAERRRAETSERHAKVSLLWNTMSNWGEDLSPFEIKTLWELAASDESFRIDFIEQLNRDPSSPARLGAKPNPIARAIGLVWPKEAIDVVRDRFRSTVTDSPVAGASNNDFRFIARVRGLSALKDQLDQEAYKKALASVEKELKRIARRPVEEVKALELTSAAVAVATLGEQLRKPVRDATRLQIKNALRERISSNRRDSFELRAVAQSITADPGYLNQQELSETVLYLSHALWENRDFRSPQIIARSIIAAAPFLDSQKIPETIINLVKSLAKIREDGSDYFARLSVLEAIEALTEAGSRNSSASVEPMAKEIFGIFEDKSQKQGNKFLIARAAMSLLSHFPSSRVKPESSKLIAFVFPKAGYAAADSIASVVFSSQSSPHASLSLKDLSGLLTEVKQSVINASQTVGTVSSEKKMDDAKPESNSVQSVNLMSAQVHLLTLVVPNLPPDGLKPVFETAVKVGKIKDPLVGEAVAEVVFALATKMDEAMRPEVLLFAKHQLANSGFLEEAAAWAKAVGALLDNEVDDEAYVKAVIEVLKYPTSAGRPTEVLLDYFHSRFSDAPVPSESPWHAVVWIEQTFPDTKALLRKPAEFPKEYLNQ
jgi:hypothetical protein